MADPRADTIGQFCRYIEKLRPRAFLLENVEGFRSHGGTELVTERLSARAGYYVSSAILDASDFGVPQCRRRYFLVGTAEEGFSFPRATHGDIERPRITAWEALRELPRVYEEDLTIQGRWAELVPSIPEGRNYLWHTDRGGGMPLFGWRTRYWSFLQKLAKDRPSPTLVASPSQNSGPYHWNNRLLSTGEMAALQSFPGGFLFAGDRASRQRQIGNAVPPVLAQEMICAIAAHLGLPSNRPAHMSSDTVPPAPLLPSAVPAKFQQLVGSHAAHPGTGRGPRPRVSRPEPFDGPSAVP